MDENCSTCYFKHDVEIQGTMPEDDYIIFTCRKNNPTINEKGFARWPLVEADDGCGRWRRVPKEG